jgi:polysaccharide biosynthesis protein PelA
MMKLLHYVTLLSLAHCLLIGIMCPVQAEEDGQPRIAPPAKRWVVYYDDKLPSDAFAPYDLIVFDRDRHPPIQNLKAEGKILLGYISAGEAERYRPDYRTVRATHELLEENPNWPGHFAVDVRKPEWTKYLIEEVIPQILHRGFQGIFIDTLDSIEDMEARDPVKYMGMVVAAAQMVRTIRLHYPNIRIMVNRGFAVMPAIAEDVDYLLAEGIQVQYDLKGGKHRLFPDAVYLEYVDKLHTLKRQAPGLQLMTLDYWDMTDTNGVKEIYRRHKANGLNPYVTTVTLDRLDPEPE